MANCYVFLIAIYRPSEVTVTEYEPVLSGK
jgi:hypothetical protein